VPLSVAQAGPPQAPGILFIHGVGQSHLSFTMQLHSELAQRYHLVAFDLRGHGNSGKPWDEAAYTDSSVWAKDLRQVMTATGLYRPVIVAWSFGTLIVADYVRQYGTDAISGILMTGATGGMVPYPKVAPDPKVMAKMQQLHDLSVSPGLEDTLEAARDMMPMLTYRSMSPEWTATGITVNAMVPGYARTGLLKHLYVSNADIVGRIQVPVLLLAGSEDKGDPMSMLQALSDALPLHATIKIYEGTGHSPFAEDPERFNADLDSFVRGSRAAP
jgi:pimeloyl-ACP methyl ester carboxylesterase